MSDPTCTIEDDGRVRIDNSQQVGDETSFSCALLASAHHPYLEVDDGRILLRGYNGTWTYVVTGIDELGTAYVVSARLIEVSDIGTDAVVERV